MREIFEDVVLALILGIGIRVLRDISKLHKEKQLYCDDDGELLPIMIVSDVDRKRVN